VFVKKKHTNTCVLCLIGKQKKPILFKVTEPSVCVCVECFTLNWKTKFVTVECLIGKQKKPILYQVTEPSPHRTELSPRAPKGRRHGPQDSLRRSSTMYASQSQALRMITLLGLGRSPLQSPKGGPGLRARLLFCFFKNK
jgi:hypothetical protein